MLFLDTNAIVYYLHDVKPYSRIVGTRSQQGMISTQAYECSTRLSSHS
ncbi:hypothetical protein PABY_14050 [Pyrodictium abyssi]|uniref:PIN domain-containing protein n=1 Tax=Pyrodictium abyssi TaxID=54256 RepID=A0ABM8IZV8_9CREN|nr:hypothetical protein PABY_14050 [Pyrodictium abyssi]